MTSTLISLLLLALPAVPQDMQSCPMHKDQHQANVQQHGDQAMGFPHDRTTHHFRLYPDGGAIEVTANDIKDEADIKAIRSHLAHIVVQFSDSDFSVPMFIHDQLPPGVEVMEKGRELISYTFEEIPAGGRLRIKTKSAETLRAVHEFLRFQIEDHRTSDSREISLSSGSEN